MSAKTYRLKPNADGVAPTVIQHPTLNVPITNEDLKSATVIKMFKNEDKYQNTNWFTTLVEEVNG